MSAVEREVAYSASLFIRHGHLQGAFRFGGDYRSCRIVKSGSRWWICGNPLGATTSKQETRPQTERHPEFADRLHADLQAKGVRCWYAPEEMKGGRKIHEQIDEAIRVYDKLLLVLSEHSMNSEWVQTEIYNARQQELRENRRKLFPIALVDFDAIRQWRAFDADSGKDMGREVREYFIPDFSRWKDHDSYQKAFDRLLADLRAST